MKSKHLGSLAGGESVAMTWALQGAYVGGTPARLTAGSLHGFLCSQSMWHNLFV